MKNYCTYCGTEMRYKERLVYYEKETGETVYRYDWVCPKRSFWFAWEHDNYTTDKTNFIV